MRAELDVSLRGDDLTPAARAVLESTREEVDRMSRTVDDLLTLAEVDEGRLELLHRAASTCATRRGGRASAAAAGGRASGLQLDVDGDAVRRRRPIRSGCTRRSRT